MRIATLVPNLIAAGAAALLLPAASVAPAPQTSSLFPAAGPSAAAVRQGELGSCYFHATIAALADSDAAALARKVEPTADGYTVHFTSGADEHVHAADVQFARTSGFDQSDGLWVSILLRGYAQRVLRQSLNAAAAQQVSNPVLRAQLQEWIGDSDLVLNAYDRAVRAVVDQSGTLSAARLQAEFHRQLAGLPLPALMRDPVEAALTSGGVFDSVAALVRQNGELFGAYRAAGNGGLPEAVMRAFGPGAQSFHRPATAETALQLAEARLRHKPVVAGTAPTSFDDLRKAGTALPADAGAWFVAAHAYTVVGFNGAEVTLRNPWGRHPEPDGVFKVPLSAFTAIFPDLTVGAEP